MPTESTPLSQFSSRRERLQTELDDRSKRYGRLTLRIRALDTDLERELDGEKRLMLEERRAEQEVKRDKLSAEMERIEQELMQLERSEPIAPAVKPEATAAAAAVSAQPTPQQRDNSQPGTAIPGDSHSKRPSRLSKRITWLIIALTVVAIALILSQLFLGRITWPPFVGTSTLPLPTTQPVTSPAPTITRMAGADIIARDNFDSTDSGWDIINESYGSSGYDKGKYFVDLSENRLFLATWEHVGPKVDNTVIEVDILGPLDRPGQSQGLGFGWHKDWKGTTYAFTVDSSGVCWVYEKVENKDLDPVASGKLAQFDRETTYHTLRAEIRNSQLRAYVDGELCVTHRVPGYTQGYVGVVATPNSQTYKDHFLFDEFRIYQIP